MGDLFTDIMSIKEYEEKIKTFKEIADWDIDSSHNALMYGGLFLILLTVPGYFLQYIGSGFAITVMLIQLLVFSILAKSYLKFKTKIKEHYKYLKFMANFFENSAEFIYLSGGENINLINTKLEKIHNQMMNGGFSNHIYESILSVFSSKISEKDTLKKFFDSNKSFEKHYKLNMTEKTINYNLSKIIKDEDLRVKIYANIASDFKFLNVNPYQVINQHEAFNILNIGVYEFDEDGYITFANEYFANLLGFNSSEFQNQSFRVQEFIVDHELTRDDIKGKLLGNWQDIIKLKSKFNEEINALVMHRVVFSERQKIEKVIGYVIKIVNKNILAQTNVEEDVWIDYAWQWFLQDGISPVALINTDGVILKSNLLFNTETSLQSNKTFVEYFDDESKQGILDELQTFADNKVYTCDPFKIKIKTSNKIVKLYLIRAKDLHGEPYGYIARLLDVTSQTQLEEQFAHSQRMQTVGYLAGSIAHDFNNLLTIILGFCDLLLERHTVGDSSYKDIIQIKQSADRAANLISRLLAFSRQQTLKPEVLDLNEIFAEYYSLIQRLVGEDISLKQDII